MVREMLLAFKLDGMIHHRGEFLREYAGSNTKFGEVVLINIIFLPWENFTAVIRIL